MTKVDTSTNRHQKALKVFWWRYRYPSMLNFGDEITAPIIESLFGVRCEYADPDDAELIGAGSIIEAAAKERRKPGLMTWGAGCIYRDSDVDWSLFDVRALRGVASVARLPQDAKPAVLALGDPGLLSSLVWKQSLQKKHALGLVAHFIDHEDPLVEKLIKAGVHFINPLWPPEVVAREIAACEAIISSSLHGLIFADSYGVPNMHIQIGTRLTGGLYKFNDYYSVFGDRRGTERIVFDDPLVAGKAVDLESIARHVEQHWVAPHDLEAIQKRLIDSFPRR